MCGAWHCFRIDPARDDGIGVDDGEINGKLTTSLAGQNRLRLAALRLWDIFEQIRKPLADAVVPHLQPNQLDELEQAVNAMAKLIGVDATAYDEARTTTLALRAIDHLIDHRQNANTTSAVDILMGNDGHLSDPIDDEFNVNSKYQAVYSILREDAEVASNNLRIQSSRCEVRYDVPE